jgi:hypothetical protein
MTQGQAAKVAPRLSRKRKVPQAFACLVGGMASSDGGIACGADSPPDAGCLGNEIGAEIYANLRAGE